MVLESTMICVDSSDYMRNGDFLPTRLLAQQDAVNLICHSKIRSNPENDVGLVTLANVEVLATLTSDAGHIFAKLHQVQSKGNISLHTGIMIAHLVLKHRQGKNHKMRIVVFVGSPVAAEENELVKLAKKLKKEKVNVDMINFGEDEINTEVLTLFINTLNGKDGSGSYLVTVPRGQHICDALISSPIIQGEGGSGGVGFSGSRFEFGVDPDEDPELALALRMSMEEQRQEDESKRAKPVSLNDATVTNLIKDQKETPVTRATPAVDFSNMTEEEQIAFVMQMSMQETNETSAKKKD